MKPLPVVGEIGQHPAPRGARRAILAVNSPVEREAVHWLADHLLDGRCCSHLTIVGSSGTLAAEWVHAIRFTIVRQLTDLVKTG